MRSDCREYDTATSRHTHTDGDADRRIHGVADGDGNRYGLVTMLDRVPVRPLTVAIGN